MVEEVKNQTQVDYSYELPPLEKKFILFRIPFRIRFALIWTIFFSLIGTAIQAIQSSNFIWPDSFSNFFSTEFINWFNSFENFTSPELYPTELSIVYAILDKWYYFFYVGGVLALLWGILSWIIHLEISFTKRRRIQQITKLQNVPEQNSQESYFENLLKQQKEQQLKQELNPQTDSLKTPNQKVAEWLQVGLLLLSEGNLEEAEMIYENIREEYDLDQDMYQELYSRIKAFYEQLLETRNGKK